MIMVCPKCRKMVPEGNAFCTSCGTPLNNASQNNPSADFSNSPFSGQSAPEKPTSGQDATFFGSGGGSQQENSFGGGFGQSQDASFTGFESNPQSGFGGFGGGDNASAFGGNESFADNPYVSSGPQSGFGGFGGGDSSSAFGDNQPFAADSPYVNPNPIPESASFPGTGTSFGAPAQKKGLPKPALIAIIAAVVLLLAAGSLLIANHAGIIHLPFLSQTGDASGGQADAGTDNHTDTGSTTGTDTGNHSDTGNTTDTDNQTGAGNMTGTDSNTTTAVPAVPSGPSDPSIGSLSVSSTDIEPPELEQYQRVSITGIDAAPGSDGTSASGMISEGTEGWKISTGDLSNSENKNIRLTFNTCGVKVIGIKAGSWTSPEDYNSDARPTKIYLKLGEYDYPLSLNDVQKEHYIVLSHPYETSELTIVLDSISNGTTGKAAITGITLYSE